MRLGVNVDKRSVIKLIYVITAMTMPGNAFSNALTGLSSGSGFLSNGLNLEVQTTAETLLEADIPENKYEVLPELTTKVSKKVKIGLHLAVFEESSETFTGENLQVDKLAMVMRTKYQSGFYKFKSLSFLNFAPEDRYDDHLELNFKNIAEKNLGYSWGKLLLEAEIKSRLSMFASAKSFTGYFNRYGLAMIAKPKFWGKPKIELAHQTFRKYNAYENVYKNKPRHLVKASLSPSKELETELEFRFNLNPDTYGYKETVALMHLKYQTAFLN